MTDTGSEKTFGPSAIATPANAVTIGRLLLSPVAFVLIVNEPSSWATVAVWFVLSTTDGVDGHIARRQGTTRSGAFRDPLADKVLSLGGMVSMVIAGVFWWVPVAIIVVREVVISIFRSYWLRRGLAVPASKGGKIKTFLQLAAVGWAALPWTSHIEWLWNGTLWAAVVMTVVSGVQYLVDGTSATTDQGEMP